MILDTNDYIIKAVGATKNRRDKFYHIFCNNCGADRGYMLKICNKKPNCNKCSKKGSKVSKVVKEKMSKAAYNRKSRIYNDIDGRTVRSLDTYARGYGVSEEHKKIRHNMKNSLNQKIKSRGFSKNKRSIFTALGYTGEMLKKHLESKFTDNMSWDNYGVNGWHIDHIIPDSWFNYNSFDCEDFNKSWALSNLQPMWGIENYSKGNRYSGSYRGKK